MLLKVATFSAYSRPVRWADGEAEPVETAGEDPEPFGPRDGCAPLPQPAMPATRTMANPAKAALDHLRALVTSSSIVSGPSPDDSRHPANEPRENLTGELPVPAPAWQETTAPSI